MDLDADDIRDVLPAAHRAAGRDLIEQFIEEWEGWVQKRIGPLPQSDAIMRGILRDLAAARTLLKLSDDEEGRLSARELKADALARLDFYENQAGTETSEVPRAYTGYLNWG